MKKIILLTLALFVGIVSYAGPDYITAPSVVSGGDNQWIAFRKDFSLDRKPKDSVFARIACDTRYWLWVNGELVVSDGQLKRGPKPGSSYCDEVEIGRWLEKGDNRIAVLVWYMGRDGLSHVDGGSPVLYFDAPSIRVSSDRMWYARKHPAFGTCDEPGTDSRLAETDIRFDARADIPGWQNAKKLSGFSYSVVVPGEPLGKLVPRPVPMWKKSDVVHLAGFYRHPGVQVDTVIGELPYDMHVNPVFTVHDPEGGRVVKVETDRARHGGADCLRAEYVTARGTNDFELPVWLSGERLWIIVPHGARIKDMAFRETCYDTGSETSPETSDGFLNFLWRKASRTAQVNMRDSFMSSPDRDRAVYPDDFASVSGASFYMFSPEVHKLMRKTIMEMCEWSSYDEALKCPAPGGPETISSRMLMAISPYGFWNYYLHTGDREVLETLYPRVRRYLTNWNLDENGLTALRPGADASGDDGGNVDTRLLESAWHYLALKGAALMADELGFAADAAWYRAVMDRIAYSFAGCWTGRGYRHPSHMGYPDGRVQALAVLAGIAGEDKYEELYYAVRNSEEAGPMMERFMVEALARMGYPDIAFARARRRFSPMVMHQYTTLSECWYPDLAGDSHVADFAGSCGIISVYAECLIGLKPLSAGWSTFLAAPDPKNLPFCTYTVHTVRGDITTSWSSGPFGYNWSITVPEGCSAVLRNPWTSDEMTVGPGVYSFAG